MPKLSAFNVIISEDEKVKNIVPIVPLVKHSGGKGPNWTIGRDHSPGGPGSIRFNNKQEVETYFKRIYPNHSIELK